MSVATIWASFLAMFVPDKFEFVPSADKPDSVLLCPCSGQIRPTQHPYMHSGPLPAEMRVTYIGIYEFTEKALVFSLIRCLASWGDMYVILDHILNHTCSFKHKES